MTCDHLRVRTIEHVANSAIEHYSAIHPQPSAQVHQPIRPEYDSGLVERRVRPDPVSADTEIPLPGSHTVIGHDLQRRRPDVTSSVIHAEPAHIRRRLGWI